MKDSKKTVYIFLLILLLTIFYLLGLKKLFLK